MLDGKFANLHNTLINTIGDDLLIGYLATNVLKVPLTEDYSHLLHSHYHQHDLARIDVKDLSKQVCLSYSLKPKIPNIVNISNESPGVNISFSIEEDPTRFFTIHCYLHPETGYCQQASTKKPGQFSFE